MISENEVFIMFWTIYTVFEPLIEFSYAGKISSKSWSNIMWKIIEHTVMAASEIVHKKKYPSIRSWTRDLEVTSSTLWHWAKKFFLKVRNFSCDFNHLVKILWRKMSNLMSNLEKLWERKFLKFFWKNWSRRCYVAFRHMASTLE